MLQLAHRVSGQPVADLAHDAARGKTPEQVLSRPSVAKPVAGPSETVAAPAKAAARPSRAKAGAHGR
jgi:hypothetical protein